MHERLLEKYFYFTIKNNKSTFRKEKYFCIEVDMSAD